MLAALEEIQGRPGASMMAASLNAAFGSMASYQAASRDFRLKDQMELDLHLTGANVLDHATRADWLGTFITRTSEAVKEIAKGIGGLKRHTPGLLVEGPSAGSVRVTFRSPSHQSRHDGVQGTEVETLDGKALHQFTSVFLLAEDEDELLGASVHELPGAARNALRLVANQVLAATWNIEGSLAARGRELQRVVISPNGAARLVEAVGDQAATVEPVKLSGAVDGWTWSKSVMDFDPASGRAFRAVVPPELQESVAAINGQPNHNAVAHFTMTTTYPSGDYNYRKTSYVLTSIEADAESDLTDLL